MKKQTIIGVILIACVALCASVLPQSVEFGDFPTGTVKTAVNSEIEAQPEETPIILLPADIPATEAEVVVESEPNKMR